MGRLGGGFLIGMQERQVDPGMPAPQLTIRRKRRLPGPFGGRMPGPPRLVNFNQGLAPNPDLLSQRTQPFRLMLHRFALARITSSVRPTPGDDGIGPVRVLGDLRLPQLPRHMQRRPPGLPLIPSPPRQQLTITGRSNLPPQVRHPQRHVRRVPASPQLR